MSEAEREAIERLERRVAELEDAVRRLIRFSTAPERSRPLPEREPAPPDPRPASWSPLVDVPSPLSSPASPSSSPSPSAHRPGASARPAIDLEQWFGQRGLLVIGVVALLAAGAFFLKYAIDRGWIPPLVRSLLAIVAGIGIAAWGEDRIRRGMRRYGATMIGAGGGLVYLGVWAAAAPYGLIDRRVGVLLLAASTVAVTLRALHHEVEGLAIFALAGAYLAPPLLRPSVPNADAFLGYLEVIGLGTGLLAHTMSWRRTFDLALFGYVLLAATGAAVALGSPLGSWLLAAGAVLTLHVTYRRTWPEARLGILLVTWAVLGDGLGRVHGSELERWLAFGAPAAVSGLLWWQELRRDPFAGAAAGDAGAVAERFLFVANPVALLVLAYTADLRVLENAPGALPTLLAFLYLAAGWLRRTAPFLVMGFALGALALAVEWRAPSVVLGWTALAAAALAAGRWAHRPGGRLAALGLASGAGLALFSVAWWSREPRAPVFSDAWALALYGYVAGAAWCAHWWGPATDATRWDHRSRALLWVLCGAAVFLGGSIQFGRYFGRSAPLAGDLALSLWWLVYAGALVSLGFRLGQKEVRSAGLAVAAGAGLKIVLYDLAALEALYRVASFFALALIALAVAYTYNKRASTEVVEGRR